jgi:hypothetical protein
MIPSGNNRKFPTALQTFYRLTYLQPKSGAGQDLDDLFRYAVTTSTPAKIGPRSITSCLLREDFESLCRFLEVRLTSSGMVFNAPVNALRQIAIIRSEVLQIIRS